MFLATLFSLLCSELCRGAEADSQQSHEKLCPPKTGEKCNGFLHYHIRPIQEAVDHYNVLQIFRLDANAER